MQVLAAVLWGLERQQEALLDEERKAQRFFYSVCACMSGRMCTCVYVHACVRVHTDVCAGVRACGDAGYRVDGQGL